MAYNIQIPNSTRTYHRNWTDPLFLKARGRDISATKSFGARPSENNTMYSYSQKIGNITPSLCFQADVFYPNAIAAVSAEEGDVDHVDGTPSIPKATGCRGNQIGRDFPLEPRLPVAIPLVQYPIQTSELFLDQCDICATPVLNWERYMESLKVALARTKFTKSPSPNERTLGPADRKRKKMERWRRKCHGLPKECRPTLEDIRTSSSSEEDNEDPESVSSSITLKKESDNDNNSAPLSLQGKKFQAQEKPITLAEMRKSLFELKPKSESSVGQRNGKTVSGTHADNAQKLAQLMKLKKKRTNIKGGGFPTLAKEKLTTVKNIPKFRLESTWNYAFGGASGACCITTKNNCPTLFVGKGTQVRQIVLEKAKSSSMLSHRVKSVYDEVKSEVPTSVVRPGSTPDPMSNSVLQVLSPRGNFGLLGVRRGRSIGIYSIDEESPYLLESIPNICYGTRTYTGWKLNSNPVIEDPLLLGLDFNPFYSAELITIDENSQVRICDIAQGTTVETHSISKPTRPSPNFFEYPKFRYINDAAGVQFGHQGHLFYAWTDSIVLLGDRRSCARARAPLINIFDLRRSTTSLSWSDQIYFNEHSIALNEYICSLKISNKENYYYVGTTSRVFLMDARVPGQPVLKFEHGTSAAAYLDTYMDGSSYEMIVSGSQRSGATLCAITDQAHVKCFDRPACTAINPVLHCLPKHMSNSREFFDTISSSGWDLSWEAEYQRAKAHNYAWTTGLTITKMDGRVQNPHEPSGVSIFTSNCYGDVFYQELEQIPVERYRKTNVSDYKFTEFAKGWQSSMKSSSKTEFMKPSLNPFKPVDYTFLIEPSARGIQRMTNIRREPFDAFKPDQLVHELDKEREIPLQKRIQELRKYTSDVAQRCLDYWEYDSGEDDEESITVKQERLDNEFNLRYANDWNVDGSRDVEYLCSKQKQAAVVDLDSLRQTDEHQQQPSSSKTSNTTRKEPEESSSSSSSESSQIENDHSDESEISGGIYEQDQSFVNDPLDISSMAITDSRSPIMLKDELIIPASPGSLETPQQIKSSDVNDSACFQFYSSQQAVSETEITEFNFFQSSQPNTGDPDDPESILQYLPDEDNAIPSSSSQIRPNTRLAARKSKSGF